LLAEDVKGKDEKLEEEVAKIRLANLYRMDFPEFPDISLSEMLQYVKNRYPERFEILYKKALEKNYGRNFTEKERVIEEYLKKEPLIAEMVYSNIHRDYDYGVNELSYPEKLKKIKEIFGFKWEELGVIFKKTPRSLQRYIAGEVEVPDDIKERIDEIYTRMFKRIGPLLKSENKNYLFRKIEEIGVEEDIKERLIRVHPEMKKYRHLSLALFFYELSKIESLKESIRKSMSRKEYLRKGTKLRNSRNPFSVKNNFRKILPVKRRKRKKEEHKDDDEGGSEDPYDFEFRRRNLKINQRIHLFFENLELEDLRGKEVQMAKVYKPKGRKYWYIRANIQGRLKRVSTKCEKKKDAEKMLKELLKNQDGEICGKTTTLYEVMDRFINEYSKVRKRSWERDIHTAQKIKEFFPNLPLSQITPTTIHNWMVERSKTSLKNGKRISPRTVNLERAFLHKVFNVAMKVWWLVDRNPVSAVEPLPYQAPVQKVYTEEDVAKVIEACKKLNITWFGKFFLFLLRTGFRRGEALRIKVGDITSKPSGGVFIKIVREKSFMEQEYPVIFRTAQKILTQNCMNKSPEDYLFTDGQGKPLTVETVRYWWKQIKKISGISGRIHDTRHTFITNLRQIGMDPDLIRWLAGQKTLDVTYQYIHLQPGDYQRMIEKSGTLLAHFEGNDDEDVV